MKIQMIHINMLRVSKTNPRKYIDPKSLDDLTASIREKGIIVPLLVRPITGSDNFEIVNGARRYTAAFQIESNSMIPCIVKAMTDDEVHEAQVIDNLQREGIHPLEEAHAFKFLMDRGHDHTPEEVGKLLGKDRSYVAESINLLKLEKKGKDLFMSGVLTLDHARLLARLTPEDQEKALGWLVDDKPPEGSRYSQDRVTKWIPVAKDVKLFRTWIDAEINLVLALAPWDKEDAGLVEAAGACTLCPKNSGFNRALFPDLQKTDTCTDRMCFKGKLDAYRRRMQKLTRKAERKDFLLLSEASYLDAEDPLKVDGVKTAGRYKVITEKTSCEFARKGQFIDGKRRGETVLVCNYSKCQKHYGAEMKTYGRQPAASAKANKNAAEQTRQFNNSRYDHTLGRMVDVKASREMFKPAMRKQIRPHLLRILVEAYASGLDWMAEIDEASTEAGFGPLKQLKKVAGSMKAEDLVDALLFLVTQSGEYEAGDMMSKLAKSVKLDIGAVRKQIEKDLHRCEVCRCSEISACGSDKPCSWRPELVKENRYVCSGCEIPAPPAAKASTTKKAHQEKAAKKTAKKKGKVGK